MIKGNAKLGGQARVSNSPLPGGILEVTGNSLPAGFSMDGAEYGNIAAVLGRRFDAAYGIGKVVWYNEGLAGRTLEQMLGSSPSDFDLIGPHYSSGKYNVLVPWEIVNSRLLTTPRDTLTQAVDLMKTYGAQAQSLGWYVVPITMSATAFDTVPDADFQAWELTDRYTVDTALRTDANTHWNALADLAANPVVAANVQVHTAQTDHPENFVGGGIHMTRWGSPFVCDAVFPLLTTPFGFPAPTSLLLKLKAVFPLWSTRPVNVAFTAPDYWGNFHCDITNGSATQFPDYIESPKSGGININAGSNPGFPLHASTAGFGVTGWFRPAAGSIGNGDDQWIAAVWSRTAGQREYVVQILAGANKLSFSTSDDGSAVSHTVTSTVTLVDGNWYWFEASYSGSQISISVNNETPVTTAASTIKTDSTSYFTLGNGDPGAGFLGAFKQFIFITAPLSSAERTYLYNGGTARTTLF